jgi:hypothetical protein
MCRWNAYIGQPPLIDELLYKPKHGLIDESLHARMGAETTQRGRVRPRLVPVRHAHRSGALPQRQSGLE